MVKELELRDGTRALAWPLLPSDREALREAYSRLSPEAQLRRFLSPVPHLTDAMLDRLVDEVDGVNHVARVLFLLEDGNEGVLAGVARMIRYPDDPTEADVAVTVADEFQGRGVASALLAELVPHRPEGVERLRTEVASDNAASLAMLRRLGPSSVEQHGPNRLVVTVELRPGQSADRRPETPPGAGRSDERRGGWSGSSRPGPR